jgi:hypothetical protein
MLVGAEAGLGAVEDVPVALDGLQAIDEGVLGELGAGLRRSPWAKLTSSVAL